MAMAFRFSPRANLAQEIAWRSWGEEAFAEAKREGKPVLLAISAIWCHWCHVMDETSYSDPEVIRIINERFIPIRVDNDQRPDINSRYNLGGWPTTAFLSPEGDLIAGGTYFPPRAMRQTLNTLADRWETDRETLEEEPAKPAGPQLAIAPSPTLVEERGPQTLAAVAQAMIDDFDLELGGFGKTAKFPQPYALEFLLAWHLHRQAAGEPTEKADRGLLRTLDALAGGELRDKLEGGFFRYCTKRDWTEPHFEKMLQDNAGLIRVFLRAGSIFGKPEYHELAAQTIDYVDRALTDRQFGAFLGSQDADEEYYRLSSAERRKLARPQSDPIIYADWNALMSLALLEAAPVLDEPGLIDRALKALTFQSEHLMDVSGAVGHFFDGNPQVFGLLSDQAWTILAFIRAFEQTQQLFWLTKAQSIAGFVLDRLLDREAGGFFDRPSEPEAGLVGIPLKPVEENGRVAEALIRLAWHTGDESYRREAGRAIAGQLDELPQYGTFGASSGLALLLYLSTPVQIEVFGNPKDRSLWEQLRRMLASPEPAAVVRQLNVSKDNIQQGTRRFDDAVLGAYFRSNEQRNGLRTEGRTVGERLKKIIPHH